MTPLITFDNTTHLNALLKNLELSIKTSSEYQWDLLLCFLDGERIGQVQSKHQEIKQFMSYEDEDIDYFKKIKEENLKNIDKLNIPNCFSNFNYKTFTKTEGYGVQQFIVLDELLETEEVLSYDYFIHSSDANFTFVPDFYESWVTQFEEINKEKNIPLLLDTSFWTHKGEYLKKIGNEYHTPQHKNIKWMTLNHDFTQMILNPKNYLEIKNHYKIPKFGVDKLLSNFSRERIDINDMCIHYESPFSTFYHYIFYYLRQSRDYTTTSINDIELYSAIENYNHIYFHNIKLKDTLPGGRPIKYPLWKDPIRYYHHVGAYSSFNLKIKEHEFILNSWELKDEVHRKYYEDLLLHQDKYYRLFDEFIEYVDSGRYELRYGQKSDTDSITLLGRPEEILEKFELMLKQHLVMRDMENPYKRINLMDELFKIENYRKRL